MSNQQRSKRRHQQKRSISKSTRRKMRYETQDALEQHQKFEEEGRSVGTKVGESATAGPDSVAPQCDPGLLQAAMAEQGLLPTVESTLVKQMVAAGAVLPPPRPWCDHTSAMPPCAVQVPQPREPYKPVRPPYYYG